MPLVPLECVQGHADHQDNEKAASVTFSRFRQHRQRVLHVLHVKVVAPESTPTEFPQRTLSGSRLPLKVAVKTLRNIYCRFYPCSIN